MTGPEYLLIPTGLIAGFLAGAGIDRLAVKFAQAAAAGGARAAAPRPVLAGIAGAAITAAGVLLSQDGPLLLCFTISFGWLLLALALVDLRSYLLPMG